MSQSRPDKPTTFDQVLELVSKLTVTEQEALLETVKLQWLRTAIDEGERSYENEGGVPSEKVFADLKERYQK